MDLEERIEALEHQLSQSMIANDILIGLLFSILTNPAMRETVEDESDAATLIRMAANGRDDQGDHLAAEILDKIADKLG